MKIKSKSLFILSLFILGVLAIAVKSARGQALPAANFVVEADTVYPKSQNHMAVLQLTVRDAAAKAGVCPYYLKGLAYVKSPSSLGLDVFEETCVNDAFGPSSGVFRWTVPQALLNAGKILKIGVNGQLIETLVYDLAQNKFVIKKR